MTGLRRLYQKNRVKRKVVRQHKGIPVSVRVEYEAERQVILQQLAAAKERGEEVVFQDEIGFSRKSFQNRDWSNAKTNINID